MCDVAKFFYSIAAQLAGPAHGEPASCARVAKRVHSWASLECREGRSSITERGVALSTVEWRPTAECRPPVSTITSEICTNEAAKPRPFSAFEACCFSMPTALNRAASVDSVALFHYATKSRADFRAKMERGSGMSKSTKTMDYFENLQQCAPFPALCGRGFATHRRWLRVHSDCCLRDQHFVIV